jgi:hypothetical protein
MIDERQLNICDRGTTIRKEKRGEVKKLHVAGTTSESLDHL